MATNINIVFIKEQYFKDHLHFIKMLDVGNFNKQSKRKYIFLNVKYQNNNVFIPLRTSLGNPNKKFGKIGFSVPSESRPDAGLDYRYILIINDFKYIEFPKSQKISNSQYKTISNNYSVIESEVTHYIKGYIRAAKKGKEKIQPLYKESSLQNFNKELNISKIQKLHKNQYEKNKEVAITQDNEIK